LVLALALTALALPSAAGSQTDFTAVRHEDGTLGTNEWYVSNVHVYWTFDPPPDSSTGCDARTVTAEGVTHFDCLATWGMTTFRDIFDVSIDKTAPAVHAVPSRPPDANVWYNHPVGVSFAGSDLTSGLAGCSSTTYSGPDNGNASVPGTCTDVAGNVGTARYGFAYDATPPTLGKVRTKPGNRSISLSWTASPDTQVTQVARSPGKKGARTTILYRGAGKTLLDKGLRAGAKYRYTVTAFDPASNPAAKTLTVTATGRLISPAPGEHVSAPLRLAWLHVKGASYYNVQLIRGRTIFSAWPSRAHMQLPRSWVYKGQRQLLRPGVYRWYVWPGFGRLVQAHYGRLLGSSSFLVSG
jgi:hypothetical protein